eukprot:Nitzschia sp. Nitz4//scaffold3_size479765//109907//111021//NITZ4_000045-RA/size479765-processed-gene-0.62-mRNA-1//1//CDS//3329550593//4374//frame0
MFLENSSMRNTRHVIRENGHQAIDRGMKSPASSHNCIHSLLQAFNSPLRLKSLVVLVVISSWIASVQGFAVLPLLGPRNQPVASVKALPGYVYYSRKMFEAGKFTPPSARRNKGVIWDVLKKHVFQPVPEPSAAPPVRVLEIAAGSGHHTEYFSTQWAIANPGRSLSWYPSDPDVASRSSIACYIDDSSLGAVGVQAPLALTLDTSGIMEEATRSYLFPTEASRLDAILCINMIHISPWAATVGLMKMAGERLTEDGKLYCYGAYRENGHMVDSNREFDLTLKGKDERFGIRDLEDVVKLANREGLELAERLEMPANNLSLVFQRKEKAAATS